MAMLAERERIEGIRQIEVAWSRVPGAESTGLHTAHPKPRSLSYSFALLPRRSLFLALSSPSLSLAVPRRLFRMRFALPSLLLLSLPHSLHPSVGFLLFTSRSLSVLPRLQVLLPLSVPFAFSVLLRVASVLSRQPPPLPTVIVVVVVLDVVVAARPLPPLAYLVGLLTLSVNHPPRRTFPASPPPPPVVDYPPPPADVSASRIASQSQPTSPSHPMANATSKSRRG